MARGHGQEVRGLSSVLRSSTDQGRFGRMFRWLRPAYPISSEADRLKADEVMKALAAAMNQNEFKKRQDEGKKLDAGITEIEEEDENPTISAGYTYLGQFIDHDITFDPASSLDKLNDPDALADFRTPRLDLDSVYGRGPDDQPYLYKGNGFRDALFLATGADKKPPELTGMRPDHQRNSENVALIGDPRNDENLLVNQIHNLFVRFHNAIVNAPGLIPEGLSEKSRFSEAQRLVRWHYQWIIVNDFLPKIVGVETTKDVLGHMPGSPFTGTGRSEPRFKVYHVRSNVPYMPVEFSVAAYRYGHSMVRPSYSLSETIQGGTNTAQFQRVPIFTATRDPNNLENLNGFRPLPESWGIDWSFFFPDLPRRAPAEFQIPQPSYRIDTLLVDPLASLPAFMAPGIVSLAERNLLRALSMQLPSGQSVAEAMGIKPMTDEELFGAREETKQVLEAFPLLKGRAPLWYYILREAEQTKRTGVPDAHGGGHHLGPVGGRIVAEVLIGLIWNDHMSYLYQAPHWSPPKETARENGKFEMSDLIRFVDGPAPFIVPPVEKPYGT